MKKFIFSAILLASNLCLNAQISIGKPSVDGESTLLDFGDAPDNTRGIILPAVTDLPETPANGNFVFDAKQNIVKVYEDGLWLNLSENGTAAHLITNSSKDIGKGVVIGSETPSAEGVMVLESQDMAMILPKIAEPHLNVKSPYPGMMCYDTTNQALAVFDGSHWFYWN